MLKKRVVLIKVTNVTAFHPLDSDYTVFDSAYISLTHLVSLS